MVCFWGFLLSRFNAANKKLQAVDIDIFTVMQLYESLIALVTETRQNFNDFESKAIKLSEMHEYEKDTRRKKKRKLSPGESQDNEVEMTGQERLRVTTFLVIIDSFLCELRKRGEAYTHYHRNFLFLTELATLSSQEVRFVSRGLTKCLCRRSRGKFRG